MVNFKIVNYNGATISWSVMIIDVAGAVAVYNPTTVAPTATISLAIPAIHSYGVLWRPSSSPVGTPTFDSLPIIDHYGQVTSFLMEDGKTYTMDVSVRPMGKLVEAGGGGGVSSSTWLWIGAGVLVVGVAAYFLLRKKSYAPVKRLARARA
jgi:hypothetical protein